MVLFFLTSRKNAAGPKGQAFEASHGEAQVSSGHPKGRVMRTWQSPHEIIGDAGCRTSFNLFVWIKFKFCSKSACFFGALFQSDLAPCFKSSQRPCSSNLILILIAFITGNSSLEPLIEGLMCSNPCESEVTCFRPKSNQGHYRLLNFLSAALSTTELW